MKKFLAVAALIAGTLTSFSQSLTYSELGVLFGQDNNYGTSRFNAMSGAFGALGGDPSAVGINPAGGAVANNSMMAITLGNRNLETDAVFYGNTTNTDNDSFLLSQAGSILSFDTRSNSDWTSYALTLNYRVKKDFDNNFVVAGNNGAALFNEHPNDTSDPINQYNNGQSQNFNSITEGQSSTFSVGFSAAHQNKLFVGASINLHNVNFNQVTRLRETNTDNDGNTLTAFNEQISTIDGGGISLGIGMIYKLHQNFRIGLAYESPTWYTEMIEDSNLAVFDPNDARYNDWLGYTEITATNISDDINSGEEFNAFAFNLRTPSKITASGAVIFDKQGLISLDYSYKDFTNTNFGNGDFTDVNQSFANNFRGVHAVNIGTEWRFDRMSLRAGYHYEQSPLKNALDDDNLQGYSAGLGYNFGNIKFDLAYRNSTQNAPYAIYNSPNVTVDPVELSKNASRITGTITFNL